jgi:hypothetical protein
MCFKKKIFCDKNCLDFCILIILRKWIFFSINIDIEISNLKTKIRLIYLYLYKSYNSAFFIQTRISGPKNKYN